MTFHPLRSAWGIGVGVLTVLHGSLLAQDLNSAETGLPPALPRSLAVAELPALGIMRHQELPSMPTEPFHRLRRVGKVDSEFGVHRVFLNSNRVFLVEGIKEPDTGGVRRGIGIVEVQSPLQFSRLGAFLADTSVSTMAPVGDLAIVASGQFEFPLPLLQSRLHFLDVKEPNNPWPLAQMDLEGAIKEVAVFGHVAYVVSCVAGDTVDPYDTVITALGISDPSMPHILGSYQLFAAFQGVAFVPTRAYATAIRNQHHTGIPWAWLEVMDLSDPQNIRRIGTYDLGDSAGALTLHENHVLIDDRQGWLRILNLDHPTQPREVGKIGMKEPAHHMSWTGRYAYIARGQSGLHILDLLDPTQPRWVGGDTTFEAREVKTDDLFLYAAAVDDGVLVLDRFDTLRLSTPIRQADGNLRFGIQGPPGARVVVQRSHDLDDWIDGELVTLTDTETTLTDTIGTANPGYYRAKKHTPPQQSTSTIQP